MKDSFNIKGFQSLVGYVSFLKHPPASKDSVIVQILKDLGAVIFCKTNIPQGMVCSFNRPYSCLNLSQI